MSIEYTSWPKEFAEQYREKGYWVDKPLTDLIMKGEDSHTAIICSGRMTKQHAPICREFTYRELREKSTLLAYYLSNDLALRAGDTALVQLPNIAEFYIAYFALMRIGVVPVNALFSHNERELTSYCEQIQPAIVIASRAHKLFSNSQFSTKLKSLSSNLERFMLVEESDWADSMDDVLIEMTPEKDQAIEAINAIENALDLKQVCENVAFFQLSGGSTGTPKLIPRTHNDYYFSIRRSAEICELNTETRYLCALPCAHNYPMSSPGAFGVFWAGGTVIMAPSPEPQLCLELIEKYQVTLAALVPPAVALWIEAAEKGNHNLESLRLIQVGGAKLSDSLARRIPEKLGCQLQQVLGMAEGLVNYTRLDDDIETIMTTQGRPMCSLDEVKVVNEMGEPVPNGMAGELVTRGPYTIRGYFNAPDHNRSVFDDEGFYYTGDLVRQDDRGYLTVVGRDKDQINRGGEKIAAEEVENLLLKHELIRHSALVAMPDQTMGEKSCAFIVPKVKNHALKSVGLRKYLRTHGIADYKIPDRFEFIEHLPLTHVGKPNKVELRRIISARLSNEKNKSL